MKRFVAGLIVGVAIAGGIAVAADMPNVGYDECEFVARNFTTEDVATPINPEPEVTEARVYQWCGQRSYGASGTLMNIPALKWVDIDRDQAEILAPVIEDLLNTDDVYLGGNP